MLITPDTNVPYTVKWSAAQHISGVICEHIENRSKNTFEMAMHVKKQGKDKTLLFYCKNIQNFPGQTCSNSLVILHWNDPLKIIQNNHLVSQNTFLLSCTNGC